MYIFDDIAFRVIEKYDLEVLRQLHNDQDTFLNLFNIDFVDECDQLSLWEGLHKKSMTVVIFSATHKIPRRY